MSQETRRHVRMFLRGTATARPTARTRQLWQRIAQQIFRLANTRPQVNQALRELNQWLDRQERRIARTRPGGATEYRDMLAGIIYLKASSLLAANEDLRETMLRDPSVTPGELRETLRSIEEDFGEELLAEVEGRTRRDLALARRVTGAGQQARALGRELQEMSSFPPVLRGQGAPQAAVTINIITIHIHKR